ncbi:MAG: AAA family ATPase [Chlorobi bacterium]|nr:AAA family ATPase [Chlorobiota bacterium]
MRPITLEITGFHSFRQKQVIKFDHLLADGLFGIFGPTGSGKSSILDAITLALYGNVHRTGYGIQGIMNKQETNASVVFTFEIGNGAERQRYTAERHFVRKKEETQVRRLRLTHHTPECDVVLAEKKGEVDQSNPKHHWPNPSGFPPCGDASAREICRLLGPNRIATWRGFATLVRVAAVWRAVR